MHLSNFFPIFLKNTILIMQIIECRRVLKWTYAYGYYLPEHETAKKQLFEYSQGKNHTYNNVELA